MNHITHLKLKRFHRNINETSTCYYWQEDLFFLGKKKKKQAVQVSPRKEKEKMKRSDKVRMTMKQEMTKTQKYLRPENSCRKQMNRVFKKTRSLLCSIICYWKKATTT